VCSRIIDPETFMQAVSDARCVFDIRTEVGFSMYLLDIGGSFRGSEDTKLKFEEITSVINPTLDKYFPSDSGVRITAEPGRYYAQLSYSQSTSLPPHKKKS
jgi:ornithine decarboxylase